MKKKKNVFKPRLPDAAVKTLRCRGGAHSTKKGKKGYNRQRDKHGWRYQAEP